MSKTEAKQETVKAPHRKSKRPKSEAKTILLGARVTEKELRDWEERYLKPGTHRSEMVRGMLRIGKARKRRGVISNEARWDYVRALLMRDSLWSLKQVLGSIGQLPKQQQLEGYQNAVKVVNREVKRIERELDALQLRGGFTTNNPALMQGTDWESYFCEELSE